MEIGNLRDRKYDVGNCAIFVAYPAWDGTTNLFADGGPLRWLGAKKGRIQWAPNPGYSELKVEEQLGDAALKRIFTGTRPTTTFNLYADLEVMQDVSPTGVASLGIESPELAKLLTVWCAPELLFKKRNPSTGRMENVPVILDAGVWKKGGVAIAADSEDERLLYMSDLAWKVDFTPLMTPFQFEEGGVALAEVEAVAQVDLDRPAGCNQILKLGEAFGEYKKFDINFAPL